MYLLHDYKYILRGDLLKEGELSKSFRSGRVINHTFGMFDRNQK